MVINEIKKTLFSLFAATVLLTSSAYADVVIPKKYINYFYNNSAQLEIPSVTMQTSGYFNQLQSYQQGFQSMDTYMTLKKSERVELREKRKELSNLNDNAVLTPKRIVDEYRGIWVRPYAGIENVQLKNGPNVSNISYGTYLGFDTEMVEFGKGWSGNVGLYGGYNGSHQTYDGIGIYMNGGTFGAVGSVYKGNYFAGLTTSSSAHTGTASSKTNDYDVIVIASGVAAKTGYNFEFKKGSFIIQPSFGMSYTYVDSFDYNTSFGLKVSPDCINAIQLEPTLKFIWNMRNNWQSYAMVSGDWNLMGDTRVDIASYQLPKVSVKPYVKYGVGIRKKWNDRFALSQQTFVYNGGRNGVGFNVDMKMAVGKK